MDKVPQRKALAMGKSPSTGGAGTGRKGPKPGYKKGGAVKTKPTKSCSY